jgi:uncharacterized surface anchored protein
VIEEIQAPVGYLLDENNPQSIFIDETDDNKLYTVTFVNKRKPAIEVIKVDADNPAVKLQGAVFRISEQGGAKTWDVTTGYNGTAILENLEIGTTYIVEELTPPAGYVNSGYREAIVLNECRTHTVTVANGRNPSLTVEKINEATGEKLPGAVFRVAARGSDEYRDVTTGFDGTVTLENLAPGWYTVTETRAPSGYVLDSTPREIEVKAGESATLTINNSMVPTLTVKKIDGESGEALFGAVFRVAKKGGTEYTDVTTGVDGAAHLAVAPGWYTVTETRAPSGYLPDETPHEIEVKAGESATVTVNNSKMPTLTITKINEKTGATLSGAVFSVTSKVGGEQTDVMTAANGKAVLSLAPGWYVVTETRAPSGYVLNSAPREIEIKPGEDAAITINNSKMPQLIIRKVDEQTGEGLSGAILRVAQGSTHKDVTTGAGGFATVSDLAPGWYTITERQAPEGYILDATPRSVQLIAGEDTEIVIQNRRKPSLTIIKIDDVTKQPLPYAKFRVTIKEGKVLGEYTTDENGRIILENLDPAMYVIEEITAPDGYHILDCVKEIRLDWGKDVVVEVPNEPVNPLIIKKVDSKTGEPLPGAKFIVTKVNGEAVGEFETGQSGYITVTNLNPGWYTVRESKAPLGYILDNTPKQVELKMNAPGIVEFENHPLNGLLITKIDSLTKEPLAGAKFKVTRKGGRLVGEYTTDANGQITVDDLEPGWYTVTETAVPDGYVIDTVSKDVEFVWGQFVAMEFTNSRKVPLQILKIDADSGEPLSGAKFRVTTVEGTLIGEYATDRYGLAAADNLTVGWYVVTELSAPDGYILDSAPRTVEVKANKPTVVEVENTKRSEIQIKKTDSSTGEPLPGAYFRVTNIEGTLVGEYITGQDGLANVPDLIPGSYIISETKCPDGYLLDTTPKTVLVKAGGTASIEFQNDRLPGLQVRKTDANTSKPLAGAKFRVEKQNGERVGEFTTNNAGFFAVPDLAPGWYTVYELAAPAGYITDPTPQSVELKANGTAVLEFSNKPLVGLQIKKVDDVTGLPLAGVEFSITEPDGRRIGTFTTDENGLIFVPGLQEGWLIVTETKALPGYKPDSTPRNVEIKSDRLNLLEYRNQPYPFLQIKKIDSESGKAISGVGFKVYDKTMRELGEFTTNEFGIIKLTGMEAGTYFIRESKAAAGYVLDETVKEAIVHWGKTTEIIVKNVPMGTLRLKKVDSLTGLPLSDAGFILYDSKGGIVGEYTTDENGMIVFPQTLLADDYKLKEIKAPDGYVLLDKPVSVTLKAGETKEVIIPNEPIRGTIQIVKKSSADNTITKAKAGATLAGAVFEIVDEKLNVVDTITTDSRGIATTKDLPLGKYAIQEITAPDFYVLDDSVFYGEIKLHGDVVKFEVLNTPAVLGVTIEKTGNVEAVPGDLIRYDFSNISNASNVALEDFFWHDELPTDAVRLETLSTGTWSERLTYKVTYRTNLKTQYRVWKDNLLTTVSNELSVSDLKLAQNEYVTDFRMEFGTVEPGFHETEAPYIMTCVLDDLPHEYRFVNKADVGAKCGKEAVYNTDSWVTIAFASERGVLPRTGY